MDVVAHTPSIITSNLSENGPMPANITETTDFFEGDSVYFIEWNDDRLNPRIPKAELNAVLDEYESVLGKPITSLQSITI